MCCLPIIVIMMVMRMMVIKVTTIANQCDRSAGSNWAPVGRGSPTLTNINAMPYNRLYNAYKSRCITSHCMTLYRIVLHYITVHFDEMFYNAKSVAWCLYLCIPWPVPNSECNVMQSL